VKAAGSYLAKNWFSTAMGALLLASAGVTAYSNPVVMMDPTFWASRVAGGVTLVAGRDPSNPFGLKPADPATPPPAEIPPTK
jgi:hypothetical protein